MDLYFPQALDIALDILLLIVFYLYLGIRPHQEELLIILMMVINFISFFFNFN